MGFSAVLVDADFGDIDVEQVEHVAKSLRRHGLKLIAKIQMGKLAKSHPLVAEYPDAFGLTRGLRKLPLDPRQNLRFVELTDTENLLPAFHGWWRNRVTALMECGVDGFYFPASNAGGASLSASVSRTIDGPVIAETWAVPDAELETLRSGRFSHVTNSLAWWSGHESWLVTEHERLQGIGAMLASVSPPDAASLPIALRRLRLAAAVVSGDGWIVPGHFVKGMDGEVRWANAQFAERIAVARGLERRGHGDVYQLRRPNIARSGEDLVLIVNGSRKPVDLIDITPPAATFDSTPFAAEGEALVPGAFTLSVERAEPPVRRQRPEEDAGTPFLPADPTRRVIISNIAPGLGANAAVKRVVGDEFVVEADVFTEGHGKIAASLLLKANDMADWQRIPMRFLENDRWTASVHLHRIGRYTFAIEAWRDEWGSFLRDVEKKAAAGTIATADIHEGKAHLLGAAQGMAAKDRNRLRRLAEKFDKLTGDALMAHATSAEVADAVTNSGYRPFSVRSENQALQVDRVAARFSSWYELFPRSAATDMGRHGTFADVILQLPEIRRMGFDTLYFPPIHPIGQRNRKGANNNLTATPGEPGSPYAIGDGSGGHDALHAELGSFDDFDRLISAAHDHGIEIALDFAIQCSPDHPWLKQHPEWFTWRQDGTIKYAENPPKRYEDIVNVDFYNDGAIPDLWLALRAIVRFWISHGIRCFRVDNPHTKPFPFWQWLIDTIQDEHPDVLFLSEAFTRPKVMYHLAKIGFSQSYTYFTWRNTKAELTAYFTELAETEVKDYFRPHLFVNTPDINPYFLQQSGRAGFLIRSCLGATLSGLFGMYSGFELCEAEALPGKEEYLDSEKYEIKRRDPRRPGNIIAEITALNRLRRAEPALQTHLNTVFYNAFDAQVLYFGKHVGDRSEILLVAVSLDPHLAREADFEVPLWEFDLSDDSSVDVEDLLTGQRNIWRGKMQHVRLEPNSPYRIWRIRPRERS